jgi:hypothetical protein
MCGGNIEVLSGGELQLDGTCIGSVFNAGGLVEV